MIKIYSFTISYWFNQLSCIVWFFDSAILTRTLFEYSNQKYYFFHAYSKLIDVYCLVQKRKFASCCIKQFSYTDETNIRRIWKKNQLQNYLIFWINKETIHTNSKWCAFQLFYRCWYRDRWKVRKIEVNSQELVFSAVSYTHLTLPTSG